MSRIGRQPIVIPEGVTVTIHDKTVTAKGTRGTLAYTLLSGISAETADGRITVASRDPQDRGLRAAWGLARAMIANIVTGVSKGFEKRLEINGVGFKAAVQGNALMLNLGFSHPVTFALPQGIAAKVEKNVISISGIDKQLVGETSAKIRNLKLPEPYKGKGIKYADEIIRRKAGKVVKAAGAG